jgi:hypothetical protein
MSNRISGLSLHDNTIVVEVELKASQLSAGSATIWSQSGSERKAEHE